MSIETKIKAEAKNLGFDVCQISQAQTPLHYENYLSWLEQGCHAGMVYMARPNAIQARYDPSLLLPGIKTILSLGLAFPPPQKKPPLKESSTFGYIAAYAVLPDYHDLITEKLNLLSKRIEGIAGSIINSRSCVDTAPIMEKDFAHLSGLGWIGRNSCLVHPRFGSWIFLSELLLDLELEPDHPIVDSGCKECQRCLMACPTKALRPDRSVDARRCLSYLTIENRGPIPEEFREAMGTRIFGCDTCQLVCPHNLDVCPNFSYKISPVLDPFPNLKWAFQLTETEFKSTYAGTPVLRAKYQGFRRNVAIAIGNSGDLDMFPLLKNAFKNENNPIVRESIMWSLSRLT